MTLRIWDADSCKNTRGFAMERLSVDELSKSLVGHLSPELIKILHDQNINGARFVGLSETTLKLFDFNLGHIIDIVTLINDIKSGSKDLLHRNTRKSVSDNVDASSESSHNRSNDSITENTDGNMADDNTITERQADQDKSNSNSETDETDSDDSGKEEAEALLNTLVKAQYFKSISRY
ncbi:Sterile alpha motif domain-containing protein 3 [Frankliniella fusca]|uniref:Sterile alpha motif domain-containing protein 3 n=1 Tax=Frankliniella fusca TaxID=407009 RepID=A0AAE1HFX3_9NEOP|nr:Sterile alpha motif domain-containing protein 3 [Frankliniella fusca]